MADPTTPPGSTLTPPSASPNAHPGDFDQAQLTSLEKSEGTATAAADAQYNATLVDEGMLASTPADLAAACGNWRELSKQAVDATTDKEKETGSGLDAETKLRRTIAYLRGKASMKIKQNPSWSEADKAAFRSRYYIGHDIFADGATAVQSAKAVVDHAGADSLPGINPAKLASAAADLTAFEGRDAPQSAQQKKATELRAERDLKFADVMRLRQEIQHAADTAYPWWAELSAATRRLFLLPVGRPFTS
jgi:hypothetical protein